MNYNSRIFLAISIFFAVVALGALILLRGNGSIFYRGAKTPGAMKSALTDMVTGSKPENALPDADFDEVYDGNNVYTPVEATPEPTPEPEPMPTPEPIVEPETFPVRYFSFETETIDTPLNMRIEPDISSKITNHLAKRTKGYVLKPGNEWSLVVTSKGNIGYCATEYLMMTEISVDDFPSKYLDQVAAPDEALDQRFNIVKDETGDDQSADDTEDVTDTETSDTQEVTDQTTGDAAASQDAGAAMQNIESHTPDGGAATP